MLNLSCSSAIYLVYSRHLYATLAQLVELRFCKPVVVGSSPTGGSTWRDDREAEGARLERECRVTYRGFESHSLRHVDVCKNLKIEDYDYRGAY